ncbi:hypothetical protein FC35_GL001718 [Limosilactobacillus coleohominis DSM 14060]|nr:hypothetical protein FC35_GL001718 [Limosilactobacillus coleohominis DSM 14060]
MQQKYQTLDRLNQAWNNNVWSHTIYHWDEIVVPNELGDAWGPEGSHTIVAGLSLDYLRFQSAAFKIFIGWKSGRLKSMMITPQL